MYRPFSDYWTHEVHGSVAGLGSLKRNFDLPTTLARRRYECWNLVQPFELFVCEPLFEDSSAHNMLLRCNVTSVGARLNALGLCRSPFAGSCRPARWAVPRIAGSKCVGWPLRWQTSPAHRTGENPSLSRRYTSSGIGTQQSPPTEHPPKEDDDKSSSIFQRFKNVAKKYWYIVLPVHVVTSIVWFGLFYIVVSSGVDVPALLEWLGFPKSIIDKVKNGHSWKSHMIIVYALYKIFTPLRYMVTLGGTGIAKRYLNKLGYAVRDSKKP